MSKLNLYLNISSKSHKIKIYPFFEELHGLFPTRNFEIYDDSGRGTGPFIFYPKYSDWVEYKTGYKLGEKLRIKAVNKYASDVIQKKLDDLKKKFSVMPRKKKVDIYKTYLTINGFLEGLLDHDEDLIAMTDWESILGSIEYSLEFMEDELYDAI